MSQETRLHPIDWFERHRASSKNYLDFISEEISRLSEDAPIDFDPFSIDLSQSQAEAVYVIRPELEERLYPWDNQVIVGKTGSGKTSLLWSFPKDKMKNLLLVEIHLKDIVAPEDESGMANGQFSLISPHRLVAPIFTEFWKECMLTPSARRSYYPRMRLDPTWQRWFHWFYNHYTPISSEIHGEHELTAWLDSPLPGRTPKNFTTPAQVLRELAALICSPDIASSSPREKHAFNLFEGILVWIDEVDSLPESAKLRFVSDFQNLYDMHIPGLYFKLFAGMEWKTALRNIKCIRERRVQFLSMPEWSEDELKELLRRRLMPLTASGNIADNWTEKISKSYLSYPAKMTLLTRIVKRAIEVSRQDGIDAPIHALCLTQGVLHFCAERKVQCQQVREMNEKPPAPISVTEIEALLASYDPQQKEE